MAKTRTLNEAMEDGDALGEAEIRYRLLAEVFEEKPSLRSNLNGQLERAKAEILRLRAMQTTKPKQDGKVVAFDPGRFRKSTG